MHTSIQTIPSLLLNVFFYRRFWNLSITWVNSIKMNERVSYVIMLLLFACFLYSLLHVCFLSCSLTLTLSRGGPAESGRVARQFGKSPLRWLSRLVRGQCTYVQYELGYTRTLLCAAAARADRLGRRAAGVRGGVRARHPV